MSSKSAKAAVFATGTPSTVGIVTAFLDDPWLALPILRFPATLVGCGPLAGMERT
jgi:hypothetical protein